MHAYKDAIHRSAGAYVLYPGTEPERCPEYHEILPGLGAFALKPTEDGEAKGIAVLREFVNEVLLHVASQITQHERGRYWESEAYGEETITEDVAPAAGFLTRPPADTVVLLGHVKSAAHFEWIRREKRYNLRADSRTGSVGLDSRELGAELVILCEAGSGDVELWRVIGGPELVERDHMVSLGYPAPGGHVYFCLSIERVMDPEWSRRLTLHMIDELRRDLAPRAPFGAPVATSWLQIVRAVARRP